MTTIRTQAPNAPARNGKNGKRPIKNSAKIIARDKTTLNKVICSGDKIRLTQTPTA